ncbi:MAG: hypothetical protein K6U12_05625 [Armatimonadetes bacterium]|nr:hypothetical protein [Armatimonadota bacterium]
MNSVVETDCRASVESVLAQLPAGVPMLALGQTVFWDEPMKASLLPCLQHSSPPRPFLFGVHDTDYFGRAHTRAIPPDAYVADGFAMLPHNDGSTRALWASAGEISQLFGCEVFPTREQFRRFGGSLERLARNTPNGRQALIDQLTEAWGWRGLVTTDPHPRPIAEMPLAKVLPALDALLQWGFEGTLECLANPEQRAYAQSQAERIRQAVHQRAQAMPNGNLADLYRYLYPDFLRALIGDIPEFVGFTRTSELLQFNTQTAHLPRFRLVDLFVNPATRTLCENAYNACLAGSEIYTLDQFGEGALPFDLLIPNEGRGTLLLTERYLTVLTPEPKVVRLQEPVESVAQLAAVVEQHFGTECVLVGKAITLISMLAHEFIFVFSERGSPYIARTVAMNRQIQQAGVALNLHPIVRVRYPTWDSLASTECVAFRLPEHLARAFGQSELCSHEFARRWRTVVEQQRSLLDALARQKRPRDLMRFLAEHEDPAWAQQLERYEAIQTQLRAIGQHAETLRQQAHALYETRRQLRRAYCENPREQKHLAHTLHEIKVKIRELNRQRVHVGRTADAQALRQQARELETQAEYARIRMIRNALLTAEGLTYTNTRPASWWFRLLTPQWFHACAQNIQITFETLGG